MPKWLLKKNISENKTFFIFLLLMFAFRSSLADWNTVPTGSMQPTIVVGDRILVNKVAYDIRIPFTNISIVKLGDPKRGDIIIFDSTVSNIRLVKRVVGLPGDVIEMHDNVLRINGQTLSYDTVGTSELSWEKTEDLLGAKHRVRVHRNGSRHSSFSPLMIPDNMYLALGDNRDNSADSRVIGFIPRDEIIGRTQRVVMSLDYNNHYVPRKERFLKTL